MRIFSLPDKWNLASHYIKPLLPLFEDEQITDILVNRYDSIFYDHHKEGMCHSTCQFKDENELQLLIEQIARELEQHFDADLFPIFHGRLPDGTRICATHRTITPSGISAAFRLHSFAQYSLADLVALGTLTESMAEFLTGAVIDGANILVSGATASGKTTLLNSLCSAIPSHERVIRCEDTQELIVNMNNTLGCEAPKRRAQEHGLNVSLATLIETALRQRPDRILVGEIREPGAADAYLQAINTGHRGTCATIHANSARRAMTRLQAQASATGNLPYDVLETEILQNLDLIIHIERIFGEGRKITEIVQINDTKLVCIYPYHP